MIVVDGMSIDLVHLRHDGRSYGIRSEELDVGDNATRGDLFSAVERHLDLDNGVLANHELDIAEETANATIRPAAKFG